MTKTEIANLIGELYAQEVLRQEADHKERLAEWQRTGKGDTRRNYGSPRQQALIDVRNKLGIPLAKWSRGVAHGFAVGESPYHHQVRLANEL